MTRKTQRVVDVVRIAMLVLLAVLCIGIALSSEKNVEKVLILIAVFIALFAPVRKEKNIGWCFLVMAFLVMSIYSAYYFTAIVKNHTENVDTVWSSTYYRTSAARAGEMLIYTVARDKTCYISPSCWYKGWAELYVGNCVEDESIPGTVNREEIKNLDKFEDAGFQEIWKNFTLVSEEPIKLGRAGEEQHVYVNCTGLRSDSAEVVFFNDTEGNIYFESRSEWNANK